jgi:hypothetical protein
MTRKRKILVLGGSLAAIAAAGIVALALRNPTRAPGILEVPLGVEEAVIITSDSSPLEPVPFAWGVAINVRIAGARDVPSGHVYDVRYIVNRAGDFDLKDYLRYSDGKPPEGLPSFQVRGLERLSQSIEARIAETEETGITLHDWYYETLSILAMAWVAWLGLLIFWRRRRVRAAAPAAAGPTLAERIGACLRQLESGAMDARQRAELELMIFRLWRQERSWAEQPMAQSLAAFRADPEVAQAYAVLENWLHRAVPAASPLQVAQAVRSRLEKSASPPAPETLPT